MATVPQLYQGLKGTTAVDTIRNLPLRGDTNNGLSRPTLKLNWTSTTPLENGTGLRQSVLLTNMGGTRGVLPCKGVSSLGSDGGATRVLRRPAIPQAGGMYPQTGFARGQRKGLAYSAEKSISLPLIPTADSFNAGLNSTIPQPSYMVY